MTSLTQEEARERSGLIDVLGYHVELDLTGGDDTFGSVTTVRCLEAGGITGSLRRLLADQLEDLRRSLAVRSAG